ncbi:MAG: hypothetical protein ACK6AD_04125 [Cyanobacteriota bacterium]|jgi:hypothetical protein
MDVAQMELPMPVYNAFSGLNDKGYDLPNQNWLPVGPAFKLNKLADATAVELEYSGEVLAASITNGNGIYFVIRLNNKPPTYLSRGSLKTTDLQCEISTKSVYVGLPKGIYTVQIYAQAANAGSSAKGVVLDPGGWGEAILVTEL